MRSGQLDEGCGLGLGVGALADGVLVVLQKRRLDAAVLPQSIHVGVDGTGALADDPVLPAAVANRGGQDTLLGGVGVGHAAVFDELVGQQVIDVGGVEGLPDRLGGDLLAGLLGDPLDHAGEVDLHGARQLDTVLAGQEVGDAALAGLAVDPDDSLVAAAHVPRVDGQVGHFPEPGVALLHRVHALLDGVLVRAGKGGEDQVAGIGMALVDRQLVAVLGDLADLGDVGEVDHGIDALGVEVQAQGDQVDVAGALAVAEQRALDAVGAGHDAELGGGHAGAAVVVRMQAEDHRLAVLDGAVEPLDLVGIDVGRGHLHGGRQV